MTGRQLRRGNWSVQEMERLRQLLPRRGVQYTAVLLRRSVDSVFRKALDLLKVPARRGPWTGSDDARLRDSWGAVEVRLLGPMLGRPIAEVVRRAAELRARLRSGAWDRSELQALKELFGTRHDEDLEVALQRPRAEVVAMAASLCLAKDKRFAAQTQRPREAAAVQPAAQPTIQPTIQPAVQPAVPQRQSMPRWQAEEIVKLRDLYAELDNLEVARRLGRTVTSVANKANQLGLKKSPRLLADIGRNNVGLRYGRGGDAAGGAGATEAAAAP